MLRRCEAEGCKTWTLGSLCLEHQPPPAGPAARRLPPPADTDSAKAVIAAVLATGDSEACRPGDPRFASLLSSCAGFRVVTPNGRIGHVKRLSSAPDGRPLALLVRTGLLRPRLIELPIAEIDWIIPAGRRILLAQAPGATTMNSETIGRRHGGARDRVEGYQVITIDGARVGTVTSTSEHHLLVRWGSWPRRSLRALPVEQAVIRDLDRTVLMLTSPQALQRLARPAGALTRGTATVPRLRSRDEKRNGMSEENKELVRGWYGAWNRAISNGRRILRRPAA
jgi:hypothetical protein